VKKKPSVIWLTEKPAQIQTTSLGLMTEIRLVMTVAPQSLICPAGRTYPRNLAPIIRTIRINPLSQTCLLVFQLW